MLSPGAGEDRGWPADGLREEQRELSFWQLSLYTFLGLCAGVGEGGVGGPPGDPPGSQPPVRGPPLRGRASLSWLLAGIF